MFGSLRGTLAVAGVAVLAAAMTGCNPPEPPHYTLTIHGPQRVAHGQSVTFTLSGQGLGAGKPCPQQLDWDFGDYSGAQHVKLTERLGKPSDPHPLVQRLANGDCVTTANAARGPRATFLAHYGGAAALSHDFVEVELSADGGLTTAYGSTSTDVLPPTGATAPSSPSTPAGASGPTVAWFTPQTIPAYNDHPFGVTTVANAPGRAASIAVTDDAPPASAADDFVALYNPDVSDRFSSSPSSVYGAGLPNAIGAAARGIVSADLDNDGKPDLAVAQQGDGNQDGPGVVWLHNNGDGSFTGPTGATSTTPYPVDSQPRGIVADTFAGSGLNDLATANSAAGNTSVLVNGSGTNPAGVFGTAQNFASGGSSPVSIASEDLNGDGKPDLVVANQGSGVSILRNTSTAGGLSFAAAQAASGYSGHAPDGVAVGDLNHDGKPDVVVTNLTDDTVSVLINTTAAGSSSFSFAEHKYSVPGLQPWAVALGDFNGDGHLDIATANHASNNASIFLNNGDGTFTTGVNLAAGQAPDAIAAGTLGSFGLTTGGSRDSLVIANYGAASPDTAGSITIAQSAGGQPAGASVHAAAARRAGSQRTRSRSLKIKMSMELLGFAKGQSSYGAGGTGHLHGAAARGIVTTQLLGPKKSLRGVPAGLRDLMHADLFASGDASIYFAPNLFNPVVFRGTLVARSRRHPSTIACFRLAPGKSIGGQPPTTEQLTLIGATGRAAGLQLKATIGALSIMRPAADPGTLSFGRRRPHALPASCRAAVKRLRKR